ncbi:MAG TPA: carboxymuconolactone decarboxylase family protein [Microlunatus sp.]|nr:carboxymuconolactone decarboxylase family protein [Microlunatus sp.]
MDRRTLATLEVSAIGLGCMGLSTNYGEPLDTTTGVNLILVGHLRRATENGLTEDELTEALIHLAFCAGWPKAMSAVQVAKKVFADN